MIMSDKRTYVIQTCLEILLAAAVVESGDAPSVREALFHLSLDDFRYAECLPEAINMR